MKTYLFEEKKFKNEGLLALYIWLKDQKINFSYFEENNFIIELPDFKINDVYVKIIYNAMFNEKGEPFNNYLKEYWWEDFKKIENAKIQILKEDEMRKYIKYVNTFYGKDFLKSKKIR